MASIDDVRYSASKRRLVAVQDMALPHLVNAALAAILAGRTGRAEFAAVCREIERRPGGREAALAMAQARDERRRRSLPAARIGLICRECGKRWKVRAGALDVECPRCGGTDWDVREAGE